MNGFSPALTALVVIVGVIEVGLLVVALIVLIRTPSDRLTLPRWAWVLICFIQLVGPIAFLLAGRSAPTQQLPTPTAPSSSAGTVVSELYPDDK
jgi:hypothetical protein